MIEVTEHGKIVVYYYLFNQQVGNNMLWYK